MNNGFYNIKPIEVVVGTDAKTATKATFSTAYVPFETSMGFQWAIYTADGAMIYAGSNVVGEAELSQWRDSDVFIINCMSTIAGLEVIW